jgi:hypothetical protein
MKNSCILKIIETSVFVLHLSLKNKELTIIVKTEISTVKSIFLRFFEIFDKNIFVYMDKYDQKIRKTRKF